VIQQPGGGYLVYSPSPQMQLFGGGQGVQKQQQVQAGGSMGPIGAMGGAARPGAGAKGVREGGMEQGDGMQMGKLSKSHGAQKGQRSRKAGGFPAAGGVRVFDVTVRIPLSRHETFTPSCTFLEIFS
jgi:hypothetical protein